MKNGKTYTVFSHLGQCIRQTSLKPIHIVIPIILSFSAAVFDGLSKAILIPLIKGMSHMDFGFVKKIPIFERITAIVPNAFEISDTFVFGLLIVMIFVASALYHVLEYLAILAMAYQVRRCSDDLRKAIFGRYLNFGKLFFDKANFGYINTVLMNFTNVIANNMVRIQKVLTEFFRLVVYLLILFAISWKLTSFVLIVFPILYYLLSWLIKRIKQTSIDLALSKELLGKKAFNVLSNMPLVKSYTRETREKESFAGISSARRGLEFSVDKKQNLVKPIQELFMITGFLFLIAAIKLIITNGRTDDFSGFLVYLYILRNSTTSFGVLNTFRATVASLTGPAKEVAKIFDDKDKYFVINGKENFNGLQKEVEFRHLSFSYTSKGRGILKDISFFIKKGEITAIVGPTGGGKTTIIQLLMRFYECPPESIFIDGVDIRNFTSESLMHHIALVSQDTLLFNDTLKKNIKYGVDTVSKEAFADSLKKARLYDFLTILPNGLNTLIGDKGIKISGGEKQRVSIARALLKGAEILILDEATSSLDTGTERLIQGAIEEAMRGRTSIVIAHRLSTIKNADKIIVIEDGGIVEQGSLKGLLKKKGKFYQYWEEQKFY
jgi:subfamily B ATP-binding cassette protein MsbA